MLNLTFRICIPTVSAQGTLAAKKYEDDVPKEVKAKRLTEIILMQNAISKKKNAARIGSVYETLVEGESKKSDQDWKGRNYENITNDISKREC